MGDLSTLAKARKELEEMYLGIPDDSVNLTFQDLAVATQNATDKKKSNSKELNPEVIKTSKEGTPLHRIPSLDSSQALQASNNHNHNHHNHHLDHVQRDSGDLYSVHHHHSLGVESQSHHHHGHRNHVNPNGHSGFGHAVEGSIAYDDASVMSRASMYPERAGRRRPGIPHSNISVPSALTTSIYSGIDAWYIQRAGKVGYPSMVKQAELMWAEKGPRRSGERGSGHNGVESSRLRSPMTPRAHVGSNPDQSSFVMGSPYSPYTPTHPHHLAF